MSTQFFSLVTLCIASFLYSSNVASQESISDAVEASRKVYYGVNQSGVDYIRNCDSNIVYKTTLHGTLIEERNSDVVIQYYYDSSSLLRFIYKLDNGKEPKEYRYYYTYVLHEKINLPVLCRFINPDGDLIEGFNINIDDYVNIKNAYELKKRLKIECNTLKVIDSYNMKAEKVLRESDEKFEMNIVNNLDSLDEESFFCWDTETYFLDKTTRDTIKQIFKYGCDVGCMVYTDNITFRLKIDKLEIYVDRGTIYTLGVGNSTSLISRPNNFTQETELRSYYHEGKLEIEVEEMRLNGILFDYEIKKY